MELNKQSIGRKVEILTKYFYICAFCRGMGGMSSNKGIKCPICLGKGTVTVTAPAVICAYCNGIGKRHLRKRHPHTTLTCTVCEGKGVVSVGTTEIETCPTCKGKGIGRERGKAFPCLICKGTGVISINRR